MNDNMKDNDNMNDDDLPVQRILKSWPVLMTSDFKDVHFDVTALSDGGYAVMMNFYCEGEEPPYSGYTWQTNMSGDSIQECRVRLQVLIETGLLDGLTIWGEGVIYNEGGDEIGTVDWNEWDEEDEDATIAEALEDAFGATAKVDGKPTLH